MISDVDDTWMIRLYLAGVRPQSAEAILGVKKLCDRALWLHKGEVVMKDRSREVVKHYTRFLQVNEDDELTAEEL